MTQHSEAESPKNLMREFNTPKQKSTLLDNLLSAIDDEETRSRVAKRVEENPDYLLEFIGQEYLKGNPDYLFAIFPNINSGEKIMRFLSDLDTDHLSVDDQSRLPKKVAEHIARILKKAEKERDTDELTGIGSPALLLRELEKARKAYERSTYTKDGKEGVHPKHYSVIFADMDFLKSFNDTFGHSIGDYALRAFANKLNDFRPTDIIARNGGDEFVILLNNTDHAGAEIVATRLKERLNGATITIGKEKYPLSASIGFASSELLYKDRIEKHFKEVKEEQGEKVTLPQSEGDLPSGDVDYDEVLHLADMVMIIEKYTNPDRVARGATLTPIDDTIHNTPH